MNQVIQDVLGGSLRYLRAPLEQKIHEVAKTQLGEHVEVQALLKQLRDACVCDDLWFVVLHEAVSYYYIHGLSLQNWFAPYLPGLSKIVTIVIPDPNATGQLLQWCSTFPGSLPDVQYNSPRYILACSAVQNAMINIDHSWCTSKDQFIATKVPPFLDYIADVLHVPSRLLQQQMFTSVLIEIWIGLRDSCFQSAFGLIAHNQSICGLWHSRCEAGSSVTTEEKAIYYTKLKSRYWSLWEQHLLHIDENLNHQIRLMGASSSQRAIVLQSAHPDLLSDRRNANRRISIPSSMTSHGTHVQYHRRDSFGTPHQPTDRQIALQTLPTNHQGMVSPQDPIRIRHNNPQNHPIISPLFPPPGHYLPARPDPKPANIALHQALVQDAKIIIVDPSTSPKPDVKYFQYMKCFAVSPILIRPEDYNISGEFEVPHDFICGTSIDHFDKVSGSATRSIQKGSQTYRLRCIEIGENEKVGESQWCVAETIWPTAICIFLNGKSLEIRRKLQHSSDKPIDFTSLVSSGVNHLQLSLLHPSQPATARSAYLVAIELLELTDSETIKREVQTGEAHVIVEEMCNSSNTNDSDFEVIQGDVIISITDPFTSRLIETPVRGKDCRHFECFDLGIFLATRTGYPCPPEQLRCPICAADARPCSLRVNGWMAGVLQEVKRMGQPEARAIVLLNMGGWRIEDTRKEDLKDARTEDNCNDLRRLGRRISTVNVEKKAIVH